MSAQTLNLNDKTVVLAGPFGQLLQNLGASLTENGADVAMITDQIDQAQRYCHNLMDLREVSERYGRSAAIESKVTNEDEAQDAFSRAAEVFGSVDIYIDANLCTMKLPSDEAAVDKADAIYDEAFKKSQLLSQTALSFIQGRSKSRLIYLIHELDFKLLNKMGSSKPAEFKKHIEKSSKEYFKKQLTVNAVSLGITEQYLMNKYQGKKTIREALAEMQSQSDNVRLVDYADISTILSFVASPLSTAINGQILTVNHGAN